MNTEVYLVRHAHSPYVPNAEATRGLSERGRADAVRVTERLLEEDITVVVSSPYERAFQTVIGLAETIGTTVVIEPTFRERRLAAGHVEDFETAIERVWRNPTFAWPGGESNVEAQQRGIDGLEKILKEYAGQAIAVGTHGNVMTLIMNAYDDHYDFEFWQSLSMPDIYRMSFEEMKLRSIEPISV